MRDFVAQYRFHFLAAHRLEQAGRDRNQRVVLECAGGKGVRRALENRHFRHADARLAGEFLHRLYQPVLGAALGAVDHARAGAPLGHPFGDEQRDDRAAEAEHGRKTEQEVEVETFLGEKTVQPENMDHHGQDHQDGDVRDKEQGDTFHGFTDLL